MRTATAHIDTGARGAPGRRRRFRRRSIAALAVLVLFASSCGSGSGEKESEGDDKGPNVESKVDASDAKSPEEAAQIWIDEEFKESSLTPEEQKEEMQWFIEAAEPF
jgi:hypothetical protein